MVTKTGKRIRTSGGRLVDYVRTAAALAMFAGSAAGGVEFNSNWPVRGKRVININTVV